MTDGQRCKKSSACMEQAVAWEYPTMGPPRVLCRAHAKSSKARIAPFWGELDLSEASPVSGDVETTPAMYRAWANENNWPIGERGRIPSELREAYHEANEPED